MMQQYNEIKAKYKNEILFFRLGDFYEMFGSDAEIAAKILEIALTGRDAGQAGRIPMCGIPFHAAENYIAKLVDKGYKVAICEQVEDPKAAKGIVRRDVVRVISPGTLMEASMLEEKRNNYLVAVRSYQSDFGLAVVDISTGEFRAADIKGINPLARLIDELTRLGPAEILVSKEQDESLTAQIRRSTGSLVSEIGERAFRLNEATQTLAAHFGVMNLAGFGWQGMELGVCAAGALLSYLLGQGGGSLGHLSKLSPYCLENYMLLDLATRRNLELVRTIREQDKKGSLLGVLDFSQTAMGGRLLKQWIEQPLLNRTEILERQNLVEALVDDFMLRTDLRGLLKEVYDLERLLGRIVYGTANAKDLLALKHSLAVLPAIREVLMRPDPMDTATPLAGLAEELDILGDVWELLENSINPTAPFTLREGNLLRTGFNSEIDELRYVAGHGKEWVASLEASEREKTGIKSLKVGFNKVFGYYLEVTQANLANVPEYYIRKQTLANAERFITPELKEYESKILGAEEKLVALEYRVFCEVRDKVGQRALGIQQSAQVVARLDVVASLGEAAIRNNYIKPSIVETGEIRIVDGRHPVVEKVLNGSLFVPNDTQLDQAENRLAIITGPNMAGKSTYMRQVALIVLMAQMGSFVPASQAQIGVVDRIFTRVGASDDLSTGQSTFMVEMNEVANILNNATQNSLIVLDEIGRGTATYDGLSIAWAVAEYIHASGKIGAKTLFATHYHELTQLAEQLPGVCNYRVAVSEKGDNIVFLRKIVPGSADRSYGIQVARLAGLPA
ncbi:MAG TPA: DNA mismatch repair protein MutS, partial [Verrucomicrobiae bacterium]|nr:DNA mismatch repair protein MutS [Verrucomicrobiae bacterium]